jgi:hypothetical protein
MEHPARSEGVRRRTGGAAQGRPRRAPQRHPRQRQRSARPLLRLGRLSRQRIDRQPQAPPRDPRKLPQDRVCDDLVSDFTSEHIEAILLDRAEKHPNDKGRIVGGQVAATNLREELDRLFRYARKPQWRDDNPVEDAAPVGKARLAGYYSWTEADIAQYQAHHAIGTKPRLALEIMLWTGQRRGDASRFGRRHIVRGKINFQASKNGADLWLPIAPDLRRAIAAMAAIGRRVLPRHRIWQAVQRSTGWATRCANGATTRVYRAARRTACARRSAGARRRARATQPGIKAVGGWRGDAEVRTYTESVDQERLADATLGRVIDRFSQGNDGENG